MLDALPRAQVLDDVPFFLPPVGRNKDCDGLAKHLSRRVSEEPAGRSVPGGNRAVERLGDDGIIGRLDHGGQKRPGILCGLVAAEG